MNDSYRSRCAAEPAVLPRVDPVLHGEWDSSAPLTREQATKFDRDGYLVLKNWFSQDEVALLQAEMDWILANPDGLAAETVVTEANRNEVRSIFDIHAQNHVIRRLSADERLAGVAQFLLDDEVYIHQSRLNYKPGFEGKEFYWHSDFETWHAEDGMPRMRALSMSVLLAENGAQNGPLMLIPGSQREFISCVGETPEDHHKSSLKNQHVGVPDKRTLRRLADEHGIDAPTGDPGTVVIFDCNTMHGSNGNITPYPRANAFFVYNAVSNQLAEPFAASRPRPGYLAAREVHPIRPIAGRLTEQAA